MPELTPHRRLPGTIFDYTLTQSVEDDDKMCTHIFDFQMRFVVPHSDQISAPYCGREGGREGGHADLLRHMFAYLKLYSYIVQHTGQLTVGCWANFLTRRLQKIECGTSFMMISFFFLRQYIFGLSHRKRRNL